MTEKEYCFCEDNYVCMVCRAFLNGVRKRNNDGSVADVVRKALNCPGCKELQEKLDAAIMRSNDLQLFQQHAEAELEKLREEIKTLQNSSKKE